MEVIRKGENDLGHYIALMLEKNIYSDRAIMKTCYTLTDGYYIHITNLSPEQFVVYFYAKSDAPEKEFFPVQQFLEELHDNQLRQILLSETQVVHEEIVRKAFAPVAQLVARDCETDELNIMISVV